MSTRYLQALMLALLASGCGRIVPLDRDAVADGDVEGDLPSEVVDVTGEDLTGDPGPCTTDEDCDDDDPCTDDTCMDGGTCDHAYNTEPCSDAWECTTGETCDGAGNCTGGMLDDTVCGTGELCRPDCFPETGCGLAPTWLVVDCPDEATLPADASCTLTLDGVADQVGCIDCTTEIGPVVIARDDFGDASGTCGMGGWSLLTGSACLDRVDDGAPCTLGGGARVCCADAGTIAVSVSSDCRLRTDARLNCGGAGDSCEWRMERTLDTSDLSDIEVCFSTAHSGATENEGMLLYAEDSSHAEQVFCQMGPPATAAPVDREWPHCVALPSWAADNTALVLRFIMHSHDDDDRLYLDDVVVRGWPAGCTPSRTAVLEEDFDPCTSIIGDGWNGWSVTGSPDCSDTCTGGSPGAARASDETWTLSRTVDTSTLGTDVRLCFDAGDTDAVSSSEQIQVEIDTGTGWQEAWYWERDWGASGECERVCLNLSDIDPSSARNPSLQIRFTVQSGNTDSYVYIDDIVLDGAAFCDGAGSASVGVVADAGGGSYTFDLVDDAGIPMWADVTCSWDDPPDPVVGSDGTAFTSP
jgi:hypothetical protein